MINFKKTLSTMLIFFLFIPSSICFPSQNLEYKTILIIGSYSIDNQWESSVIRGFTESIDPQAILKFEFLDSKNTSSENYVEGFNEFLSLKYKKDNIDYILTIDDEALDFVRLHYSNKDNVFHKKPVVFVGTNKHLFFTDFERKYITGILDYQDNQLAINTILKSDKNITDIYLLLDNSIYSSTIKDNIKNLTTISVRPFNCHVLQGNSLYELKDSIKNINAKTSAIYLCGSYYSNDEKHMISPDGVISELQSITSCPIYTKLEPYVKAGAIGGIINDGYRLGSMASVFMIRNLTESNTDMLFPAYNTLNIPLFNYDALRNYGINPLVLPTNSVFINKGRFDLLVPAHIQYLIWTSIALSILFFIYFIYLFIKNKKQAYLSHILLSESIERNNIRTDFIITMSHELRTPLNVIINATKLLHMKVDNNLLDVPYYQRQLGFINKNSNRLLKLVNNLIDVSKLESGYMDTSFTMDNIVDIVEEATISVVDLAKSNDINIIFDTEYEEIITAIDKHKIERIMLNLLSNSIKFMDGGGEILVFIHKLDDNVIIEVKDNGIGISPELQSHIFEKFKREQSALHLSREQEGSGLGLFIVKGLVSLHNGTISVESTLNVGTTFKISLPIVTIDRNTFSSTLLDNSLKHLVDLELSDVD